MARSRQSDRVGQKPIVVATMALFAAAVIGSVFWYWPSKVQLDANTYEIAISLYRTCNQRDLQGLKAVQDKLNEFAQDDQLDPNGLPEIQSIIDLGLEENWRQAMVDARDLLDQQVER